MVVRVDAGDSELPGGRAKIVVLVVPASRDELEASVDDSIEELTVLVSKEEDSVRNTMDELAVLVGRTTKLRVVVAGHSPQPHLNDSYKFSV